MEIPIERNTTYQISETVKWLYMFTEFKIYHKKVVQVHICEKISGKDFGSKRNHTELKHSPQNHQNSGQDSLLSAHSYFLPSTSTCVLVTVNLRL